MRIELENILTASAGDYLKSRFGSPQSYNFIGVHRFEGEPSGYEVALQRLADHVPDNTEVVTDLKITPTSPGLYLSGTALIRQDNNSE